MPTPPFSHLPFTIDAAAHERAKFTCAAADGLSALTPTGIFLRSPGSYLIYYLADAEDERASVSLFLNGCEIAACRDCGKLLCGGTYAILTDVSRRASVELRQCSSIPCCVHGFLIIADISP